MLNGIRGVKQEQLWMGQGAVFLCAVLWSTSGLFIKLVDWHPALIAGGRSFLAAAVLLVLRGFQARAAAPCPRRSLPALLCDGFWYAATMILFVAANKLTASANAILLQYAAPVWAFLLGWFFLNEKPRWEHWAALGMVGAGMFLVLRSGLGGGSLAGDLLALLSGMVFAANSVVMRKRKDGNPADIMIASHVLCVCFSLPFFVVRPPHPDAGNLLSIAFMGIFQIGAASALFAYGIRRVRAGEAMLIAAVEPVLNPLWVLLVTGERPASGVIFGGGVIVAAVVFSSLVSRRRMLSGRPYSRISSSR